MKLVTTSLAVSTIILSLCGAAVAQTSLDPNAQGRSRSNIGVPPPADGKAGATGSATTGAGVKAPGMKSGAGASGDVSGQGSVGGSAGGTSGGAGVGASGKARGSGTLGN